MEFLPSGNPQIRIWDPPGNMQHKGFHANMVLGNNLHHMAPFSILEAGFCMVFRRASFMFSVPWAGFGTPGPKFWPGLGLGPFWSENWGSGKMVLWKNDFPGGDYGGPPEGNGSYGVQEAFGQVISPQTHLGN